MAIIGSPTLMAPGPVPCHWRKGGPIKLADDNEASAGPPVEVSHIAAMVGEH